MWHFAIRRGTGAENALFAARTRVRLLISEAVMSFTMLPATFSKGVKW